LPIMCCGRSGLAGRFEWPAVAIGVAAFLALFRYQVGIIPVIGACAGLGWVYFLVI